MAFDHLARTSRVDLRCSRAPVGHEALQELGQFQQLLDGADLFLSRPAADAAQTCMQTFLARYAWLHTHLGHNAGTKRFAMRPKHHWAAHVGWLCQWQNPRSAWNYRSEDWIGRMSRIGHSVSHATRASRIAGPLLHKYRCMLHLRLTRGYFED